MRYGVVSTGALKEAVPVCLFQPLVVDRYVPGTQAGKHPNHGYGHVFNVDRTQPDWLSSWWYAHLFDLLMVWSLSASSHLSQPAQPEEGGAQRIAVCSGSGCCMPAPQSEKWLQNVPWQLRLGSQQQLEATVQQPPRLYDAGRCHIVHMGGLYLPSNPMYPSSGHRVS